MAAEWKKLYSPADKLIYEGFTVANKPYGAGVTYYSNGSVYQEGVFDVKGLVYGREYYPSGGLRFEGAYEINHGYGPNYPIYGKCYNESGEKYHDGKISVSRSGMGFPKICEPEGYGSVVGDGRPEITYFMWEDKEKN